MKRNMNKHNDVLEEIATHPDIVGIYKKDVSSIIKDINILKYKNTNQDDECDLIFLYDHPRNYSDLVEIKSDRSCSSSHAHQQLVNTSRKFCDRIGYPTNKMMVVYYPSMRIEHLD